MIALNKKLAVAAMALAFLGAGAHIGVAQQPNGAADWTPPPGYVDAYPGDSAKPNMVARQGYASGFTQGQSDSTRGRKFDPDGAKFFKDVPSSPKGFDRDAFKASYREAFTRGYTRGYKKQ